MVSCLSGINCYAAEKTQDSVKLVITTDKTSYDANDTIHANITLENNSDSDITDISLEGVIPENFRLSDNSKAIRRSTYIMSGGSMSSELELIPDKIQSSEPVTEAIKTEAAVKEEVQEAKITETPLSYNESAAENSVQPESSGLKNKLIVSGIFLLAAAGVVIIFRKKGKNGALILLCVTAAGALAMDNTANAEGPETHTISVSETISVADREYQLTAVVRFTMDTPDMQAAVEEYYAENSEEIVSVENAEETDDVLTEKEAIAFMAERGFSSYPLTYDFNIDGTYADEAEASADSDEKHPMYQTFYVSDSNAIWTVFIIGRSIFANPASYNLESDLDAQVLVSETDTLTSYTEMGNKFYETVPKESAVILKVVDKISSQKLNDLKYEEVIGQ